MSPTELTEPELLTLAALARAVMRLDGTVSQAERRALEELRLHVRESSGPNVSSPYRAPAAPQEPLPPARWKTLLERAGREIGDESALQASARAIERPDAQTAIFALLADLAFADGLAPAEAGALTWLEELWGLETTALS